MKFTILILLVFSINAYSQCSRRTWGERFAKTELKLALSNKSKHNVIDNKNLIIKDSLTAKDIAEPLLFSIYGKENIERQKPYESYLIENYWVIAGQLPKGSLGGKFLIIIDARNSEVLKITHEK